MCFPLYRNSRSATSDFEDFLDERERILSKKAAKQNIVPDEVNSRQKRQDETAVSLGIVAA